MSAIGERIREAANGLAQHRALDESAFLKNLNEFFKGVAEKIPATLTALRQTDNIDPVVWAFDTQGTRLPEEDTARVKEIPCYPEIFETTLERKAKIGVFEIPEFKQVQVVLDGRPQSLRSSFTDTALARDISGFLLRTTSEMRERLEKTLFMLRDERILPEPLIWGMKAPPTRGMEARMLSMPAYLGLEMLAKDCDVSIGVGRVPQTGLLEVIVAPERGYAPALEIKRYDAA